MKRNLLVIVLAVLVLLPSCLKGDFSAYSTGYERSISVVDGYPTDQLKLKVELSDKETSYTFKIFSPDDVLSWEGKLYPEEGMFVSDVLLLTPGVLFPVGEYRIQINSDSGSTKDSSITVPAVDTWKHVAEVEGSDDVKVLYLDETGNPSENKEGSVAASFNYVDRYKNPISITENF